MHPINNQLIPVVIARAESVERFARDMTYVYSIDPSKLQLKKINPSKLRVQAFEYLDNPKTTKVSISIPGDLDQPWIKALTDSWQCLINNLKLLKTDIDQLAKACTQKLNGSLDSARKNITKLIKQHMLSYQSCGTGLNHNPIFDREISLKRALFEMVDDDKKPEPMSNGFNPSNPNIRNYDANEEILRFAD